MFEPFLKMIERIFKNPIKHKARRKVSSIKLLDTEAVFHHLSTSQKINKSIIFFPQTNETSFNEEVFIILNELFFSMKIVYYCNYVLFNILHSQGGGDECVNTRNSSSLFTNTTSSSSMMIPDTIINPKKNTDEVKVKEGEYILPISSSSIKTVYQYQEILHSFIHETLLFMDTFTINFINEQYDFSLSLSQIPLSTIMDKIQSYYSIAFPTHKFTLLMPTTNIPNYIIGDEYLLVYLLLRILNEMTNDIDTVTLDVSSNREKENGKYTDIILLFSYSSKTIIKITDLYIVEKIIMSHNGTIEYIMSSDISIPNNEIKITITVLDYSMKSTSFPSPSKHPHFNIHKERVHLTKFNEISQKINKYISSKQTKEQQETEKEEEDLKEKLLQQQKKYNSRDKGDQETIINITKKGSGSAIFKNNNRLSLDIHIQQKKNNSIYLKTQPSPLKPLSLLEMENIQILIVDDSPMNSKFLRHLLITHTLFKKEQIEVMENGTDVLSAVITQNKKYNIIFMDNNMPFLKGYVIIKILRSLSINSFIIGVTGDNIDVWDNEMLLAGANLVFSKPIKTLNLDLVKEYYMTYGGDSISEGFHFINNAPFPQKLEDPPF